MAREHFFHAPTPQLFKKLEELARRSGVSRGQAFEDWLTAMVCALAAETKEAEYLAMVERHKEGKPGKRGVDLMGEMFGHLVDAMEGNDDDVLGDLYQGAITYGEDGQYFTPESLARLMAQLSVDADGRADDGKPLLINDPCCGTGRLLLEASKINPRAEVVGQDIDARCVRISAINLGLRGRFGWIICGNSLSLKTQFAYRIGSFFHESEKGLRRGVIREVPVEETPVGMIAGTTRRDSRDLLDGRNTAAATVEHQAIIEVPRWVERVERSLAAFECDASASSGVARDLQPKQQTLF